jgi:hypothetical protein
VNETAHSRTVMDVLTDLLNGHLTKHQAYVEIQNITNADAVNGLLRVLQPQSVAKDAAASDQLRKE